MMKIESTPITDLARGTQVGSARETRPRFAWRATAILAIGVLALFAYAGARLASAGLAALPALLAAGLPCLAAGLVWWQCALAVSGGKRALAALAAGLTLWAGAAASDLLSLYPAASQVLMQTLLGAAANLAWIYTLVCLRRDTPLVPRIDGAIETLLVWSCGTTLAAYFILEPGGQVPGAIFLFAHAASALALFGALVGFRYLASGPLSQARMLTLCGLFAALVGDGWQLKVAVRGAVASAPVLVIHGLAALLFGAAVYYAVRPPQWAKLVNRWENLAAWLPMACLATVISLPILNFSRGGPLDQNISLGVFFCLALAVLRLGFSLSENRYLRQERARLLWQNQEYIRLAISDPLTGLFNKGYFEYRLKVEVEKSQRDQQPLTLIALDLDNFKLVNDRYGHAAGDLLLKDIGQALRNGIRAVDLACRVGGDEFTLILPRTTAEQGVILAERLRAAIALAIARRGLADVSTSAGVASFPQMARSLEELPRLADVALYQSKQRGKNCTSIYTPAT